MISHARTAEPQPTSDSAPGALDTWWHAVGVIAHREVLRQVSQPAALVTQAAQLGFFVLVYAVGFGSMIGITSGVSFSVYVFPGILAIQIVSTGVTAGLTFAFDRDYGFMREMLVAPIPRLAIPIGKTVGVTAQACAYGALILLVAPVMGVPLTVVSFSISLVICAAACVVFCVLGLLLATTVRRVEVLQGVIQLAMFPLLFLSGSVFSPQQTPGWLQAGIYVNPMTYAVDLLRQVLLAPLTANPPAMLPAWADISVLAGCGLFLLAGLRIRVGR